MIGVQGRIQTERWTPSKALLQHVYTRVLETIRRKPQLFHHEACNFPRTNRHSAISKALDLIKKFSSSPIHPLHADLLWGNKKYCLFYLAHLGILMARIAKNIFNGRQGFLQQTFSSAWASYQIRKIAGCACARYAGNFFFLPPTSKGKASYRSRHASRHVRHACRDCESAVAGKTYPAYPAHAQSAVLRIW